MKDTIKIAIVGETNVGKTTFLKAFANTYRSKKGKYFRIEFDNRETAEFLSGYHSMQDGVFPESTLEHSKANLRWKVFLNEMPRPVYLESVDPIGQYMSSKSLGGKKRFEEYEEQISVADAALIFIDSTALKSRSINFWDYKELFCKCKEAQCKVAVLLTKSDLIYDDLSSPVEFLEGYFPELDSGVYVQFVSIGEKEDLKGTKILNIYKTYGLDEFSCWIADVFFELSPVEAFLDSSEVILLQGLRQRKVLAEEKVSALNSYRGLSLEDAISSSIRSTRQAIESSPSFLSCLFNGYDYGEVSRKKEQLKSLLKEEEEVRRHYLRVKHDQRKESERIRKEISEINEKIESLLVLAKERKSFIKGKRISNSFRCNSDCGEQSSAEESQASSKLAGIFTYDVFNRDFSCNNYWNISNSFLENSGWESVIQRASSSADLGLISTCDYFGVFKIFERVVPAGERRQWYAILWLINREEVRAIDVLKVLKSEFWNQRTCCDGLCEEEETWDCLWGSGDLVVGGDSISKLSRMITSRMAFSFYRMLSLTINTRSLRANIFYK